jgi:hypothetical protein
LISDFTESKKHLNNINLKLFYKKRLNMNIVYIILGAVLLVLLIIVVMYLIARSKGKITINLSKYEFSAGEKITGTLVLRMKKPVHAKAINIGLIGIRESKNYSKKGSRSSSDEIFNFSKPLDGEKDYAPGENTYNFEIAIPIDINKQATGNQIADTLIKSMQILSGTNASIEWYVTANLDMPGFDISKKVRVNIA